MSALSVFFGLARGALPLLGGFFTGGLGFVWSFLSAAWGTEIGRTVIIALGCLFGGWVWGFSHEHAVKERAVAAAVDQQNKEWLRKIEAANDENDRRVQEALNAGKNVAPAPVDSAARIELCRTDKACRSALGQEQRVPVAPSNLGAKRLRRDDKRDKAPSSGLF